MRTADGGRRCVRTSENFALRLRRRQGDTRKTFPLARLADSSLTEGLIPVVRRKRQSSLEKHLLEGTHNIDAMLDAVAKYSLDWHSIADHPGIFDQYRAGRLYFHIHFSWLFNRPGQIEAHDLYAIYRRLPNTSGHILGKCLSGGDCDSEGNWPELRYCDEKQAMFVNDVQLMKHPNNVVSPSVVSRVRLQLLDFCEGRTADEWGDSSCTGISELFGR